MAYNFEGSKILVTGAAGSIGGGIATMLADLGATVYGLDSNKAGLEDLVKKHPQIIPVHQDLQNWEETEQTVDQLGAMDGLVNCAATAFPPQSVTDMPKENLYKCLDVNLNAPVNLMQVVGKKMRDVGGSGSIVNISSLAGLVAAQGFLPYSVSKAGLDMATKMFALELGPYNIRVNTVNLGLVSSDMSKSFAPAGAVDRMKSKTPLDRLVEVRDVGELVIFLLSEKSRMITGTNYVLDGGLTCKLP